MTSLFHTLAAPRCAAPTRPSLRQMLSLQRSRRALAALDEAALMDIG